MKTDGNFRLSKVTKRMLSIGTKESRNHFLKMMVDAEYTYETNKKKQTKVEKD